MKLAPAATMEWLSSIFSAGRFIQSRQTGISAKRACLLCDIKVGVTGNIACLTTLDVSRLQPQMLGLWIRNPLHYFEAYLC